MSTLDDDLLESKAFSMPFGKRVLFYLVHWVAVMSIVALMALLSFFFGLIAFTLFLLVAYAQMLLCRKIFSVTWGDAFVIAFMTFSGALLVAIFLSVLIANYLPLIDFFPLGNDRLILAHIALAITTYCFGVGGWLEFGQWFSRRMEQLEKKENE